MFIPNWIVFPSLSLTPWGTHFVKTRHGSQEAMSLQDKMRHACMHAQSLIRVRLLATFGLQPARLLCPWDFPGKDARVGKDAGVGCHFLLQGIFPIQGSNLSLLHWQADLFTTEPPGKPKDETDSIRSSCVQPTHFLPLNWAWTGGGRVSREPSPLLKPKVMDGAWGRHLSVQLTFSFCCHLLCPWQPLFSLPSLQDPQDKTHLKISWFLVWGWWYTHSQASPCSLLVGHGL